MLNDSDPAVAAGKGPPPATASSSPVVSACAPVDADGAARLAAGDLAGAEAAFRIALDLRPNDAAAWHNLGVVLARQGNLPEAIAKFETALGYNPESADTHRNLALALRRQGRAIEVERHLREAVRIDPDQAAARHELGCALRIAGKLDEAVVHLREAVRLAGENVDAQHELGLALAETGQPAQARACYETALKLRPDFPEALSNLGILLEDLGAHDQAEARYRDSLKLHPRSPDTLNNLGVTLAAQRRHAEAAECYRQSLQLKPESPLALNNLGNALRTLGDVDEAMTCLRQAICLRPDYAEAHNNLGICLMELGHREEAMAGYEQALHLRPDYPEAHLNRSLAWLGDVDFSRGWTEYEWRWFGKEFKRRAYSQPLWSGARMKGQTLFLYFEQGIGDTFQFIRYAELARRRVGRVVLEVQKTLVPLLSRLRGVDVVIPAGEAPLQFDTHLPLMSLPGAFGTQIETIPADVPYICADPERVKTWQARLEDLPGFQVGIGWQGNPQYRGDRQRSIPLENFAPLAAVPGVRLISLQKGDGTQQIASLGRFPLTQFDDLDADGGAFMDTAAILENVDLLVTSDTALAHLAGAMGVLVWVALPYAADWRWFRERDDSPWYPTMRLFRQDCRGDWKQVFARIAIELAALARQRTRDRTAQPDGMAVIVQPDEAARSEFQRGTRLAKAGNLHEAAAALREAISLYPEYAEAHHNLGVTLARAQKYVDAIAAFRRTLEINPEYGEAAANLGLAYLESGQAELAVPALRQALRNHRISPDVYNHLGVALSRIGRTLEAIESYRTALRLAPELAAAHVNLAGAFVALGRYSEAWLEMEWQWSSHACSTRKLRRPRWAGEPLNGRTILVYSEASAGATLPYLKYVVGLSQLPCRVILACSPELLSKLSAAPGVYSVVPLGDSLPDHDVYVPLLSLPWLLEKSTRPPAQ
jgi:tetratricopeptide (TPR) repeat protein